MISVPSVARLLLIDDSITQRWRSEIVNNSEKNSTGAEASCRNFDELFGNFWFDYNRSNVRSCFAVALVRIVEHTGIKELVRHHAALTTNTCITQYSI